MLAFIKMTRIPLVTDEMSLKSSFDSPECSETFEHFESTVLCCSKELIFLKV